MSKLLNRIRSLLRTYEKASVWPLQPGPGNSIFVSYDGGLFKVTVERID